MPREFAPPIWSPDWMIVAVNGTDPAMACLYRPLQTPVKSSAAFLDPLMAAHAPWLTFAGASNYARMS